MSRWPEIALGEICETGAGGTPKRGTATYWNGGVPWAKISDLTAAEKYIHVTEETISEAGLDASSARMFPSETVLMAMYGSIGETAIVGTPMTTNQAIIGIQCGPDIANDYLWQYLKYQRPKLLATGRGGTQANINAAMVKAILIPLPPLDEQRRIAAILDKADDLRAKRREAIAKLDTLAQSIFIDMFGDPVTNPRQWQVVTVGDEIDFLTSGSRGWAKYYADNGDTFIRIQNLKNGRLDLSDIAFVNAPESAEAKRTRVKPGDVLLSITADLGRTAIVPDGISKAHINQHLAILRFTTLNPVFVSYQLASRGGQSQFSRLNREGVKAGLNFNDVKRIRLTKPLLDLQLRFASVVESTEQHKARLRNHLAEQNALFASLQQRAFKGEL